MEPVDTPPIRSVTPEEMESLRLKLWRKQARRIRDDVFTWMELMQEMHETHTLARDESNLRDRLQREIGIIERHRDIELENMVAWIFCEATTEERARMQPTRHLACSVEILLGVEGIETLNFDSAR